METGKLKCKERKKQYEEEEEGGKMEEKKGCKKNVMQR